MQSPQCVHSDSTSYDTSRGNATDSSFKRYDLAKIGSSSNRLPSLSGSDGDASPY